ncbi:MAG TPA: hypothetical protein VGE50_05350 [Gammaproteobacteria bacterium]
MLFAAALAALGVSLALIWAIRTPWLGVQLAAAPDGIRVVAVAPEGPSAGVLTPGDVLLSLRTPDHRVLPLPIDSIQPVPHAHATYAGNRQFHALHKLLFSAVTAGPVTLLLADGREVSVAASPSRPIDQLPWVFWALAASGIIVLLVGVGIWAFRRANTSTALVALSSVGYMISSLSLATFATREWLMDPELLWWTSAACYFGTILYGYSAMALFWYYPRPLGRFPMVWAAPLAALLISLNNMVFQIIEWPLHTFYLQYFPVFAIGVWFAQRQWINTRLRPDERAALLWFVRLGLMSLAIVMGFYFLPQLAGNERMLPYWGGQFLALGLYVGVVLGVLRFRLFDLERWWFVVWAWFLGGLLVVALDFGLVYFTNLHHVGALTLSLLIAAWVYFPVRQWAWARFLRSPSERIETLLPTLLETFFATTSSKPFQERWQGLLAQVFDPLNIRSVSRPLDEACLEYDGLVLSVPDIEGDRVVMLSGRSRGRYLFTRDDVALASLILTLARKSAALREAQERGAAVERERIARDLHDDVAPQLLTLAHSADSEENADRARTALQTLRESIYTLSETGELSLQTLLAEWRVEAAERTEAANVQLSWHESGQPPDFSLTARQRLNLARVFREALTNALRHALPETINIVIEMASHQLTVRVSHGGVIALPESWRAGKGLNNMRTRIAELGGQIMWRLQADNPAILEVCWETPLVTPAIPPQSSRPMRGADHAHSL